MLRQEIIKLIQKATNLPQENIQVERPESEVFGDYSTNVAIKFKLDPKKLAEKLKDNLFEKVEVAGPGFINFFVSKGYLQKQVKEILEQKDKFGQTDAGRGKKVNIEFISANPTGELHIGHGRGAFFGDAISNILEKSGFRVTREYFINDAQKSKQITTFKETIKNEEGPYYSEYVKKKISENKNDVIADIQKDIEGFIKNKLKIKFDKWVSEEKDIYQKGKLEKIQKWLVEKTLIYEKDKAKWIKTSRYGDFKDWVVIRETGEPTYLLADIAYHKDKFDRKFDKIIDIWGADHQGHVGKMKAVAKILGYQGDFDILISQVVRLKNGKISKREGNVVTLEWLIDEVGLDAARFFYLMKSLDTQMEFDVKLAKERNQKSPVYYVQYAHARICSILRKANANKLEAGPQSDLSEHPSELKLLKQLIRLPEIIEDTAKDYQVQRLPQYAIDLATVFHQFYRDCKVVEEGKVNKARLDLIKATRIGLKNTLDLMGISAPEEM